MTAIQKLHVPILWNWIQKLKVSNTSVFLSWSPIEISKVIYFYLVHTTTNWTIGLYYRYCQDAKARQILSYSFVKCCWYKCPKVKNISNDLDVSNKIAQENTDSPHELIIHNGEIYWDKEVEIHTFLQWRTKGKVNGRRGKCPSGWEGLMDSGFSPFGLGKQVWPAVQPAAFLLHSGPSWRRVQRMSFPLLPDISDSTFMGKVKRFGLKTRQDIGKGKGGLQIGCCVVPEQVGPAESIQSNYTKKAHLCWHSILQVGSRSCSGAEKSGIFL